MTTRQTVVDRLIEIARSQVGTGQQFINNVKYNTSYYGHEVSGEEFKWCVVFLWWCMQKAKIPMSIFPKSASVFAVRDWFDEPRRKRFFPTPTTPLRGDLAIYSYSHIGLVVDVMSNGTMLTVEGNQADAVRKVIHDLSESTIAGYCRPAYHMVEEDDMTPEQAKQLEAIFQGLTVKGTTSPEETVNLMFDRIKKIEAALVVPGTTSAEESFNMLFERIREIHKKVVG